MNVLALDLDVEWDSYGDGARRERTGRTIAGIF
jgi:hypothetical protein